MHEFLKVSKSIVFPVHKITNKKVGIRDGSIKKREDFMYSVYGRSVSNRIESEEWVGWSW